MKKFFAIALAFVMFASVNMFAQEETITNEATVDVHVLQPLTVNATDDNAELIVINTQDWAPGNQTTDNNVLVWTIEGSGGHNMTWILTTADPTFDSETLDFFFDVVDSRSGATNDAGTTPTSGDVVTSTAAPINATHAGEQSMTVTLTITGAATTGATAGQYSAVQTLTAEYNL